MLQDFARILIAKNGSYLRPLSLLHTADLIIQIRLNSFVLEDNYQSRNYCTTLSIYITLYFSMPATNGKVSEDSILRFLLFERFLMETATV